MSVNFPMDNYEMWRSSQAPKPLRRTRNDDADRAGLISLPAIPRYLRPANLTNNPSQITAKKVNPASETDAFSFPVLTARREDPKEEKEAPLPKFCDDYESLNKNAETYFEEREDPLSDSDEKKDYSFLRFQDDLENNPKEDSLTDSEEQENLSYVPESKERHWPRRICGDYKNLGKNDDSDSEEGENQFSDLEDMQVHNVYRDDGNISPKSADSDSETDSETDIPLLGPKKLSKFISAEEEAVNQSREKLRKRIEVLKALRAQDTVGYARSKALACQQELKEKGFADSQNHKILATSSEETLYVVHKEHKLGKGATKAPVITSKITGLNSETPQVSFFALSEVTSENPDFKSIQHEKEIDTHLKKKAETTDRILTADRFILKEKEAIVITPLCHGDLNDLIGSRLPYALKLEVARQMALALADFHKTETIHRDLHPGNFLFTIEEDGTVRVKITDFGTCAVKGTDLGKTIGRFNASYVDPLFHDPAILKYFKETGDHSNSTDMFMFGLTLLNLFSNVSQAEFTNQLLRIEANGDMGKLMRRKLEIAEWSIWEKIEDRSLKRFLQQLLSDLPYERPSAEESALILGKIITDYKPKDETDNIADLIAEKL